ncbi:MAG: DUF6063 family protein [Desulfotomaculaceae bacterium]|nr:DUF6063 family protein [Desulfotomaculaceae bacterium]
MEWYKDDVMWAFRIFTKLLHNGVIDENERDYHYAYQRIEVRQVLEEVIEREAEVKIFAAGGNLYLTPGVDNNFFGYRNAELREQMKLRNNSELYLSYFVILCFLAKFYNSEDQSLTSRQFVPLEELEETVTEHVNTVLEAKTEEVELQEEKYQLNLRSVSESWLDMPAFDDSVKNLKIARNNRVSFLLRVMKFLEEEGLVQILEDREIRILPKMEHLVVKYYFHSQRKEMLLELLSRPRPLKLEI